MRAVVLALLLGAASAFAPMHKTVRSTAMMGSLEGLPGVGPETGNKVWDPLSFGTLSNTVSGVHDSFWPDSKWLREAEIKHSRAAMLAFVGTMIAQTNVVFPGELGGNFYKPTVWYDGLASACSTNAFGMAQLFLAIGLIEGFTFPGEFWTGGGDREPGDLDFYPFGTAEKNNRDFDELRTSELKNGRLAMISMAALFAEHQIPGSVPLLYGDI
jgi:hypothetical protein